MIIEIVFKPVIILFILALVGVLIARLGILNESFLEGIAKLVFNITLPLLIFTTLVHLDLSPQVLVSSGFFILFCYLSIFLLLLTGKISSGLSGLDQRASNIHTLHSAFGNIVFIGYPLMNALFPGGMGLYYACLYHIVSNSVLWSMGIYILNRDEGKRPSMAPGKMININTIAFFSGLCFLLLKIRLPGILDEPLSGLGSTTLYLSMLYIGGLMAGARLHHFYKRATAYLIILNKMILSPLILYFGLSQLVRLPGISFDTIALKVLVLQAGMPCMAIIVVIARQYGADDRHAMENVLVTTIPALLTLSFLYFLMDRI